MHIYRKLGDVGVKQVIDCPFNLIRTTTKNTMLQHCCVCVCVISNRRNILFGQMMLSCLFYRWRNESWWSSITCSSFCNLRGESQFKSRQVWLQNLCLTPITFPNSLIHASKKRKKPHILGLERISFRKWRHKCCLQHHFKDWEIAASFRSPWSLMSQLGSKTLVPLHTFFQGRLEQAPVCRVECGNQSSDHSKSQAWELSLTLGESQRSQPNLCLGLFEGNNFKWCLSFIDITWKVTLKCQMQSGGCILWILASIRGVSCMSKWLS